MLASTWLGVGCKRPRLFSYSFLPLAPLAYTQCSGKYRTKEPQGTGKWRRDWRRIDLVGAAVGAYPIAWQALRAEQEDNVTERTRVLDTRNCDRKCRRAHHVGVV